MKVSFASLNNVRTGMDRNSAEFLSKNPVQENSLPENEKTLINKGKLPITSFHSFGDIPLFSGCNKGIQPKLKVNSPDDKYEKEADRVAETVMRMPDPDLQRQPVEEDEEEEVIQTKKREHTPEASTLNNTKLDSLNSGGQPLPDGAKGFFEPRFGFDFGKVRIHNDESAHEAARSINARAFTTGRNIVFGKGQYAPDSDSGRRLLAHELTHVVQQNSNPTIQPMIQRWVYLGKEYWKVPSWGARDVPVYTGTQDEWKSELDNIDDKDEYRESLQGFLEVSNDPSIVNRTKPPSYIGNVPYKNTITRAPNNAEKLEFLRALYAMGGKLDLWQGGALEGGPYVRSANKELGEFLNANQDKLISDVSNKGQVVDSAGVQAIVGQTGKEPTMEMIIKAGATAHKGVDLIMTANRLKGQEKQTAHAQAMETIRNAGRIIRETLKAHDAKIAFQKQVVGVIFDQVWSIIPGGGTIASIGKDLLKTGLKEALDKAQAESGPGSQAEKINNEFVATCNKLVMQGEILSGDAQDAIIGFEAVRR
jgi:hypothetical protein